MKVKKSKKDEALRELIGDLDYDGDDFTPPVQIAFIEAVLSEQKSRGLSFAPEVVVDAVAAAFELDAAEMQAVYAARKNVSASAKATRGKAGELEVLAKLRPGKGQFNGRFGLTFDDEAAKTLAKAWSRLDPAQFGKTIFSGLDDLRLKNFGPRAAIDGLEFATDAKWLELQLKPGCELTPLSKLSRLSTLALSGKLEGFGPLAKLIKLTTLTTEANERGLEELAAVPTLRVLNLTVGPRVDLSGLLALKKLNMVVLLAGTRKLDARLAGTIAALAKRKIALRLAAHEGWPAQLQLPKKETPGYVTLNLG